ncbi:hypothetical protein ACO0KV_16640 [Undibacterium sp. RuRC25W]
MMFFFRHPKSVVDPRAVAVQMVKQNATTEFNANVIVINDEPIKKQTVISAPDPVLTVAIKKKT